MVPEGIGRLRHVWRLVPSLPKEFQSYARYTKLLNRAEWLHVLRLLNARLLAPGHVTRDRQGRELSNYAFT